MNPEIRIKPNGGVFTMELSYEEKIEMYHKWKNKP